MGRNVEHAIKTNLNVANIKIEIIWFITKKTEENKWADSTLDEIDLILKFMFNTI